jgi:hypothetical protein
VPPPPPSPQQIDAEDWAKFYGLTNDRQLAALSLQVWHLTQWVQYLNLFDLSGLPPNPSGGGGAGAPPPPPPKWPP